MGVVGVSTCHTRTRSNYQPTNVVFGLIPSLDRPPRQTTRSHGKTMADRALRDAGEISQDRGAHSDHW